MKNRYSFALQGLLGMLFLTGPLWGSPPGSSFVTKIIDCLKSPVFCFSSPSSSSSGGAVLARVGDDLITASDLESRLEEMPEKYRGLYVSPQARRQLLDNMVEEKLYAMAARREGLDRDPDYRKQLAAMEETLLRQTLQNRLGNFSEAEIRKYFADHPAEFQAHTQYMLTRVQVKTLAEARKAQALFNKVRPFSQAASALSRANLPAPTSTGMNLITPVPHKTTPMISAIYELRKGQVSAPIKDGEGYLVLRVEDVRPYQARSFEEAKSQIKSQLQSIKIAEWTKKMRASIAVSVDEKALAAVPAPSESAR